VATKKTEEEVIEVPTPKEMAQAEKEVSKAVTQEAKALEKLSEAQQAAAEATAKVEEAADGLVAKAEVAGDPEVLMYTVVGQWAGVPLYGTTFDAFTTIDLDRMKEYVAANRPLHSASAAVVEKLRVDNYGNTVKPTE
jgi:hypothetical protein